MEHAEMVKHIRARVAASGISARVQKNTVCGSNWITVKPINIDTDFTPDECKTIKIIAKVNGFTHVRGLKIDENLYTCRDLVFEM